MHHDSHGDVLPSDNGSPAVDPSPGTSSSGSPESEPFVPPYTFDDPDLIQFYLHDGPYLDLYTDKVYFALIRCTDPETGWAFPSISDIAYLAKMKTTAVRKYLKPLCDAEFGLGKFHKILRQNGSESNGYFLNAWSGGLVPEPINDPSDDPLGEAQRLAIQRRHAEKDWEIETRDLHIEQLKAQLEALGATPVSPDEPLRVTNPFARRTPPPPLPEEPPPPDYSDVDQWVEENWERLHRGGLNNFIGYREWVRKNPHEIETQEERWRAADRADGRVSQQQREADSQEHRVPVWDGPPPDPQAERLWKTVLDSLKGRLPRPTFETWLKPTVGMAIETGEAEALVVVAPTPFAVEWLERRMFHALHGELQKVAERPMEIQLRVAGPVAGAEPVEGNESEPGHGELHDDPGFVMGSE